MLSYTPARYVIIGYLSSVLLLFMMLIT